MGSSIVTALDSGEYNIIDIIQINEIPDISILDSNLKEEEVAKKYRKSFEEIITEFTMSCREYLNLEYENQDFAIELVYQAKQASHQTYNAAIETFVVIRGIHSDLNCLRNKIEEMKNLVITALHYNKISTLEVEDKKSVFEEIKSKLLSPQEKRILMKKNRVESLQNGYLPEVRIFDTFPDKNANFTKIVNTMMQYPDSLVILELVPTRLTPNEMNALDNIVNVLETIRNNRSEMGTSLPMLSIEKALETYKYYDHYKNGILFAYNIIISAPSFSINNITSKLSSELSIGENGRFIELDCKQLSDDEIDIDTYYPSLPWVVNEITTEDYMEERASYGLARLPFIITQEEASNFFRLPYGDNTLTAGIRINKSEFGMKEYNKQVIDHGDIMVGTLKNASRSQIGFSLGDLTKHMLIVGTPGSGKTTFSVGLLDQIWKEHHIPFLVIEPAKNEYRAMIDSIPDIQVFTPGKDFISPYIINPFIPPKGVQLQSYKTVLKTAFSAAISLTTPLDKIFEETIDECYSKAGWLSYYTIDDGGEIFTMDDFLKTFMEVFERIGYRGEASNIGKAGYVRLKSLLKLLGSYHTIPISDLLTKPTIIELAAIENEEQKSLMIALLLLNIQSYVNANYIGTGEMKNILLLEEAHVLLAASDTKEGQANPSAIAKKLLTRMLAEIRSLGVGIVIADQSPEKVTSDIVKLTNMKLAFNLVEKKDRTILSDSTDMNETQTERLAKLRPGEAYFYMNGLDEPEEVITDDYRKKVSIRTTISDQEIADKTTYWLDKQEFLRPYLQCKYLGLCKSCDYKMKAKAEEYAKRIYKEYFKEEDENRDLLKKVYGNFNEILSAISQEENERLTGCAKVHFLRMIMYSTNIKLSNVGIQNTFDKEYRKEKGEKDE